jgi:hypothetical protein
MTDLIALHAANNRKTHAGWSFYESHRRRVMALIAAPDGAKVAILGAGNCNDVNLAELAKIAAQVHLVDVDDEAQAAAVGRESPEVAAKVIRHCFDLTGVLDLFSGWKTAAPLLPQLQQLTGASAEKACAKLPAPFEVVVSSGVLSQLMWACSQALGTSHPALGPIASHVAVGHLRTMVELVRPGGRAVLVTDVVSSLTHPVVQRVREIGEDRALREFDERRSCYPGTSPQFIAHVLKSDEALAGKVGRVEFVAPWLWHLSADRVHLVYGVTIHRL